LVRRVLDRLTASPRLVISTVGALFLGAYVSSVVFLPKPDGRVIVGDAVHHFVQLRSAVVDGDLDFANDYAALYGFDVDAAEGRAWLADRRTETGLVRNLMPVGPALLWAPLYGGALAMEGGGAASGGPRAAPGVSRFAQTTAGITGVIAATAAAWFAFGIARRWTTDASALAGAVGAWIGTHAVYYSLISPAYSHAASMLATTVLVWHWCGARGRWSIGAAAASGALAGVAALMRWQDVIWIAIPVVESLRMPAAPRTRVASALAACVAAAVAFTPQMIVWQALYGQPLAIPQGGGFMEWTAPNLVAVLFSDNHGLFSWSPMLLLAAAGFAGLARRERWLALPAVVVLVSSWYVNAAVSDWWAGEAFGARRFLSLFPFFVMGLAAWIGAPGARLPRRLALVAMLIVANGLLLVQYQAFLKGLRELAPYPRGVVDLFLARFVVPFRLVRHFLGAP
jgi:hypothetical protein